MDRATEAIAAGAERMTLYPNQMVPLQIDLAIGHVAWRVQMLFSDA
jgi:hypothetical protein